jgi:hypothetical protein
LSARGSAPFVAVNCGAFSESLVESELFGHERGAFTGALGARAGWFEAAQGGTLFLDEISELPLHLQVKLLRVLQEQQVVRIGSRQPIEIDVRIVASTNIDLEKAVAAGRFREDLYFRLNVATLRVTPLRARGHGVVRRVNFRQSARAGSTVLAIPDLGIDDTPFEVAGVLISKFDLVAAAIAAAMVILLTAFFRYTRIGLAFRAVADDQFAALVFLLIRPAGLFGQKLVERA